MQRLNVTPKHHPVKVIHPPRVMRATAVGHSLRPYDGRTTAGDDEGFW